MVSNAIDLSYLFFIVYEKLNEYIGRNLFEHSPRVFIDIHNNRCPSSLGIEKKKEKKNRETKKNRKC